MASANCAMTHVPPSFLRRPPRPPPQPIANGSVGICSSSVDRDGYIGDHLVTSSLPRAPPVGLELPPEAVLLRRPQQLATASRSQLVDNMSSGYSRRAFSLPPLFEEHGGGNEQNGTCGSLDSLGRVRRGSLQPPVLRNVAHFARPQAYSEALREISSQQPLSYNSRSLGRGAAAARSPIDAAIQRELIGDGIALGDAVENRRSWAVKQRHVQRSDVGHCCHACRQPLRGLNQEVTIWTGAAIYRRFHPACAASFVLRVDAGSGGGGGAADGRQQADVVEGYADGWRALLNDDGRRDRPAGAAARQWLLSQDPTVWPALRGDVFATVTIVENGKKKAVPGLTHVQIRMLRDGRGRGTVEKEDAHDGGSFPECAICFADADPNVAACVSLPCAPQHVFHDACVMPWLRKASLCPTCRTDLRPLLSANPTSHVRAGARSV